MKKKILIVGGAGYCGGYLTDVLIRAKHIVTVYDSLLYEARFLKDVKFVRGDIRDKSKLAPLLEANDIVIWLAAIVGDGACQINPVLTKSVNYDPVKWLVDTYKGKIIFTSTCSVYGMNPDLLTEESPVNPLSVYAETKLMAEQYIVNNAANYLIFRLGTLYGTGDAHSRIRLDLVVNILTKKAVEGQTLSVFGGDQWRPLLHVKDVSHAMQFGINLDTKGLFNLSEKNVTIRDIAEDIKLVLPEAKIKYTDIKTEDRRDYKVSSDHFKYLGWRPRKRLEDGIGELVTVFKEQRLKNPDDPIYSNAEYLKGVL